MPGNENLQAEVLKELTAVRERGYWALDAPSKRKIATTLLSAAAAKIPGYQATLTRTAAIGLLLKHEVGLLASPYRDWLTILLGIGEGNQRKAFDTKSLRDEAAKLAGELTENFRRTKEKDALGALAMQIASDCLGQQDESSSGTNAEPTGHIPDVVKPVKAFWRGRKNRLLLGSLVLTLVLVATVITFVVDTGNSPDNITPESLLRATILSTGTDSAYGGIFPAQLAGRASSYIDELSNSSSATDYEKVFQNELNDGAYAAGGARANITLQVLVDGEISLYDIKPVNVRRESLPLDTVILLSLGHGPSASVEVGLDQAVPVAMDTSSGRSVRFGAEEVMGLSKNAKGFIDVAFTTQAVAETFDISINYEYQGTPYTQILHRTSDGKPFRVAALMCADRLKTPAPEVGATQLERLRALRYNKVIGLDPAIDAAGNYSIKTIDPNIFAARCY